MTTEQDPVKLMKQQVGFAAADRVKSGMIVGLGTGSTTAYTIQALGDRIKSGELKDIKGVPTSFQSEVLAKQYGVPLTTLDEIDRIDVAIDGADEVDPHLNLIKGGGAAHTREKVVDYLATQFIVNWVRRFASPSKLYRWQSPPLLALLKNWAENQNFAWA
jgi:ribose 5-phosphate isomerase A